MASYDYKSKGSFDVAAIKALPGYRKHYVTPRGSGGVITQMLLIVEGVSQRDLNAAMAAYNHSEELAKQAAAEKVNQRRKRLSELGVGTLEKLDALWELVVDNKSTRSDDIKAKITQVNQEIP